jgi:5'-methylthioadenosine phosphorylase
MKTTQSEAAIGIIGGSGLYSMEALQEVKSLKIDTPFGAPSDELVSGRLHGRLVYFLPRHARGHRLLPTELPHRANLYALRSLGVRWVIAVTAVGSLQEEYRPRDIVLPDQFFDRTTRRTEHTFFGEGIVAHMAFADPISSGLRAILREVSEGLGHRVHDGGVYVNMDGPAFSTRAESQVHRQLGFDVVGMTNLAEAKLAREAEMSLATLSMVTDYDAWKVEEEPVNAQTVIGHLMANAAAAQAIVSEAVKRIPLEPSWPEHTALDAAMVTDQSLWPAATREKLAAILERWQSAHTPS